jgi:glycosyltransferase involved in cell wall biosynthesis
MRLVYVSNGPLPYHTPILNELSRRLDLRVVYMSAGHPSDGFANLWGGFADPWGVKPTFSYTYHWSRALTWRTTDFRAQFSFGVSSHLRRLQPDVILFSSWGPLAWEPLLWKRWARRKAVMWAESTTSSGLLRGRTANQLRRLILSQADAFVSNGSRASAYLELLGADPARIVTSRLPSPLADGALALCADALQTESPRDRPRYLFVGRLVPRKRPLELLQSFALVMKEIPQATLKIVGDGPLMAEVSRWAQHLGQNVALAGRVEGAPLRPIYAEADILVLPSVREVWGLVVNEALAHGLYVIATDQVESAFDLLDEGSGTTVPADDAGALACAMIEAARNVPSDAAARAARARRVADCTPSAFARDIHRAAVLAVEPRPE